MELFALLELMTTKMPTWLFILMEEIFGDRNHLGTLVTRNNPSGRSTVNGISITHEYALIFGESNLSKVGRLERNEAQINRYDESDLDGPLNG